MESFELFLQTEGILDKFPKLFAKYGKHLPFLISKLAMANLDINHIEEDALSELLHNITIYGWNYLTKWIAKRQMNKNLQ